MSIPLPRWAVGAFAPYTSFVVVLAMLFGGGTDQGLWSDAVVQLASLPLLAWALFKLAPTQLVRSARWGIVILCAVLALPLIQLIPLPPGQWSILPSHGEIASAYEAAGVALPWMPISLDPVATWRGFLSLLPAAAIFLAMLSLEGVSRHILIALVLAIVFVSVPLDLLQMMGGPDSQLRFYSVTNPDRAVGFYANANHNAALLYSAVPFAVALGIAPLRQGHRTRAAALLVVLLLFAIVIGIAATRSRAGAGLGFLAWVSSMALAWRFGTRASRQPLTKLTLGMSLLALLLAFQFGFVELAGRLQDPDLVGTFRWNILTVTTHAITRYFPFGSGFGTFVDVYQNFEPRTLLSDKYINHAHNDWFELLLEGGLLSLAVLFGFVLWLSRSILRVWRNLPSQGRIDDAVLAQAGSVVIILLLLHSGFDYPLRTTSLMAVFAISCALIVSSLLPRRSVEAALEPVPKT